MAGPLEQALVEAFMAMKEDLRLLLLEETPFIDGVLPAAAIGVHPHGGGDVTTGTIAAARLGASPTSAKLLFGDNTWAALAATDIPSLDSSKITTGSFAAARLGSGTPSATTLLWGDSAWAALVATDLPTHASRHNNGGADEVALDTSQITTGTMVPARLGSGTAAEATYLHGNSTWATLDASDLGAGTVPTARLGSGTASGSTYLHGNSTWSSLNASDLGSGTVPTARLGSGTANSTTSLFGDSTWKAAITGGGATDRVAFFSGAASLTSDSAFSYNFSNNALTATGGYISAGGQRWEFGAYTATPLSIVGFMTIAVDATTRRLAVV